MSGYTEVIPQNNGPKYFINLLFLLLYLLTWDNNQVGKVDFQIILR